MLSMNQQVKIKISFATVQKTYPSPIGLIILERERESRLTSIQHRGIVFTMIIFLLKKMS